MNTSNYQNPFPKDKDRQQIWEMLVERDIIAFCKEDWDMVANDFMYSFENNKSN
ncbi:MAG: hypothetical protein AB8G86_20305 [Saprospiraceae bacterium]